MVLPWNPLIFYARWREKYLQEHPEKRLFPWLSGGLGGLPTPEEPIITLGEKGKKIGTALVIVLVLLALASMSE